MASPERLSPAERKRRLTAAREALAARDRAGIARALERLPATGAKAAHLRASLQGFLVARSAARSVAEAGKSQHRRISPGARVPAATLQAECSVEVEFSFALADLDSPAMFDVMIRGGAVSITLNSAHPHVGQLVGKGLVVSGAGKVEVDPLWANCLRALAVLELEAPTPAARQRLAEHRADLGRRLRSAKG